MALFEINKKEILTDKYTHNTNTPQYVPRDVCPDIAELYKYDKYATLLANINKSNVSEEEKNFLRLGATRHLVFNYDKIADYYAHATPEMQELMEESALVIIDFEDAIRNGYIELSKGVQEVIQKGKQYER